MNRILALVLSLLVIASGAGAVLAIRTNQKMGVPGVEISSAPLFDEKGNQVYDRSVGLPEQILDFKSQLMPLNDKEVELPKDTTFARRIYTNASGMSFQISAVLMGKDRTSIHQPEFCLPVQGYEPQRSETIPVRIERPFAYDLPVRRIIVKAADDQGRPFSGIYVYWFVSKDNITAEHRRRMSSVFNSLLRKGVMERWAYIGYWVACAPGSEDATFDLLSRIIQESVPTFQETTGAPVNR